MGGLGAAVCELVCEGCPVPVELVGVRDRFGKSGEFEELLAYFSPIIPKPTVTKRIGIISG